VVTFKVLQICVLLSRAFSATPIFVQLPRATPSLPSGGCRTSLNRSFAAGGIASARSVDKKGACYTAASPEDVFALRRWRFLRLYFLRRFWLIGIEKTEGVRWLDHVNASLDLLLADLLVQLVHLGPMNLRLVVMFGVIAVVKPDRIIEFPVAADTPSNWFIWVPTEVAGVPYNVRKRITEIKKRGRKKKTLPV